MCSNVNGGRVTIVVDCRTREQKVTSKTVVRVPEEKIGFGTINRQVTVISRITR